MSPEALLGDPQYPRLKAFVLESTGLAYYSDKDADLALRVGHRLATTGARDCGSYLDILRDSAHGPSELDALIAEITIGETYFFRHREHFDALRDLVVPELIARNRGNRRLRIWCAGCGDGPEPYSLAILLKREMANQLQGWEVTILGTDINRRSLARARAGRFEEWAFRSMPEHLKHSCFSQDGRLRSIASEYKELVSFQYLNLVEDSFPSLVNNLVSFDLIVCRNVMIYVGPDLMKKIVQRFHDCLVPGAWLLVGPSEPNMICFTSFRTVNAPGVTLYQKPDEPAAGREMGVFAMPSVPPPPPSVDRTPIEASVDKELHPTLGDVRRHANGGDWELAAICCEQLLKKDNLNSVVHFYHALVLEQMRKHEDAERSLGRAIYLDRQSVLAHYYRGLFLQSRGDPRLAARSFGNALEILRTRSDEDAFDDADGITVAELKKLTNMHLDILREKI
jgi:chemotaxis protein methyltransferase CheR